MTLLLRQTALDRERIKSGDSRTEASPRHNGVLKTTARPTSFETPGEVEAKDDSAPVNSVFASAENPETQNTNGVSRKAGIFTVADSWQSYWLRLQAPVIGTLSLLLGIGLWHLATQYDLHFLVNFENIPPPLQVGSAFLTHFFDLEFHTHILVSMRRIGIAYSLAVVIGVLIGLLVGRSRTVRAAVLPYIEIVRPIPAVAWIPLAILMWPTEESSIVYITFLGALFPIILNTVHGVEQTPEVLVRAALSLGAGRLETFRYVVLPAALPSISAGLAIGMGVSWFSLLAGEIISGQYGIGYFTWNAYSMINYPDIIVGMLVIGGLGSLSTYAVKLAMRPSLRWNSRVR